MARITTVSDLAVAAERGRRYTDARNALVAYAVVIDETKQSTLVAEVGLDKGDVSRIVKVIKNNPAARAALENLDRTGSLDSRMHTAAEFGENYLRRTKGVSANRAKQQQGTTTTAPAVDDDSTNTPSKPVGTPNMSAADLLAALAVLRDAARSIKFTDDQSAELSVLAMDFADLSVA